MLTAKTTCIKSGHLTQEAIALYVDALKLGKVRQLPEDVLVHVADCEQCETEITDLSTLLEEQHYSRDEVHPYFDKGGRKKTWHLYRMAAILALGIGLGLSFYYFKFIRGEQTSVTPIPAPEQTEAGNETRGTGVRSPEGTVQPGGGQFANSFVESPNLENLVNNESRSSEIQVVSPRNGAVVRETILFEWQGEGNGPYGLKVFTNTEKILISRTLNKHRLALAITLSPGLYYWKLESKGDLLYIGKFFVK